MKFMRKFLKETNKELISKISKNIVCDLKK